jgi:uncharacterized repeat protein (TIGR01451 family)
MPTPIIRKDVEPAFAQPGNIVTWTVTVSNPNNVTIPQVGYTDVVPGELEIISVSAESGSIDFSGQTVTFVISSLAPGQSVATTIVTRIRDSVAPGFVIVNTAVLGEPGLPYNGQDSAQVVGATALPSTGETPLWRNMIMALGATLLAAIGILGVLSRQMTKNKNI